MLSSSSLESEWGGDDRAEDSEPRPSETSALSWMVFLLTLHEAAKGMFSSVSLSTAASAVLLSLEDEDGGGVEVGGSVICVGKTSALS